MTRERGSQLAAYGFGAIPFQSTTRALPLPMYKIKLCSKIDHGGVQDRAFTARRARQGLAADLENKPKSQSGNLVWDRGFQCLLPGQRRPLTLLPSGGALCWRLRRVRRKTANEPARLQERNKKGRPHQERQQDGLVRVSALSPCLAFFFPATSAPVLEGTATLPPTRHGPWNCLSGWQDEAARHQG